MKIEHMLIVLIIILLVVIAPQANPAASQAAGDMLNPPVDFLTELIQTVFNGLSQFQGDLWQWLLGTGISIPLTWGIVAAIKKLPQLQAVSGQVLATIVGFILFAILYAAQHFGYSSQHEIVIQMAVGILAILTGGAVTQYGASTIHDNTLDTVLSLSYDRQADSVLDELRT